MTDRIKEAIAKVAKTKQDYYQATNHIAIQSASEDVERTKWNDWNNARKELRQVFHDEYGITVDDLKNMCG